jgi:chitinase
MAAEVAEWIPRYNIDGIDLDIEEGAGSNAEAGPNMGHFVRRLRELQPDIIIGQPTYGFPQIQVIFV